MDSIAFWHDLWHSLVIAILGFLITSGNSEGTWYASSIEHYKIKYSHLVLSRFFLGLCIALECCRTSNRVFIQAPNFEIVGCLNLLILSSIHNGCLYIIEPKRRTTFTFAYTFSNMSYAIWITQVPCLKISSSDFLMCGLCVSAFSIFPHVEIGNWMFHFYSWY